MSHSRIRKIINFLHEKTTKFRLRIKWKTRVPKVNLLLLFLCFVMTLYIAGGIAETVFSGSTPNGTIFLGTIVDLRIQYFKGFSFGLVIGILGFILLRRLYQRIE